MPKVAHVLVAMSCAGQGLRSETQKDWQSLPHRRDHAPVKELMLLLLAFRSPAAFFPSSPGVGLLRGQQGIDLPKLASRLPALSMVEVLAPPEQKSEVALETDKTPGESIHHPESSANAQVDNMNEMAVLLNPASFKPKKGADGRLEPVLVLPGDNLDNTPLMKVIVAVSTIEMLGILTWAFVSSTNPLWPLLSVIMGGVAGELFSGTFHWATDNYGSLKTPVVGFACAAFQGHHLAPWTISHRSFFNNVYKIAAATIPLMSAALLLLPPSGAAFVAVLFYCQLLAQEFHRWTHIQPKLLPKWKQKLQQAGIAMPLREHLAHHRPPFDKHYCILSGGLNALLDSEPVLFWRRLEAFFYHLNGQEPLSWEEPKVKQLALRTWENDRFLRGVAKLLKLIFSAWKGGKSMADRQDSEGNHPCLKR